MGDRGRPGAGGHATRGSGGAEERSQSGRGAGLHFSGVFPDCCGETVGAKFREREGEMGWRDDGRLLPIRILDVGLEMQLEAQASSAGVEAGAGESGTRIFTGQNTRRKPARCVCGASLAGAGANLICTARLLCLQPPRGRVPCQISAQQVVCGLVRKTACLLRGVCFAMHRNITLFSDISVQPSPNSEQWAPHHPHALTSSSPSPTHGTRAPSRPAPPRTAPARSPTSSSSQCPPQPSPAL